MANNKSAIKRWHQSLKRRDRNRATRTVARSAVRNLRETATEFQFDHVTAKPLSRETWLTYATAYRDHSAGHDWILMTAMPEAFYLAGLRKANSRSAMVLALALVLSLVLGAALASMVTAPLRHMAHATRTMAGGRSKGHRARGRFEPHYR